MVTINQLQAPLALGSLNLFRQLLILLLILTENGQVHTLYLSRNFSAEFIQEDLNLRAIYMWAIFNQYE